MKKFVSLFFILLFSFSVTACVANQSSDAVQSSVQTSAPNSGATSDAAVMDAPVEALAVEIHPSSEFSTVVITGQMVEDFVAQVTAGADSTFVVQLETQDGAFADFRAKYKAGEEQFFCLDYAADSWSNVTGVCDANSLTFTCKTAQLKMEELAFLYLYVYEGENAPFTTEYLPMAQVTVADEGVLAPAADEFDMVGIYLDLYDEIGVLTIATDAFGYIADFNGTCYSLAVDESDGGDYHAYIGTAEDGSRFCLSFAQEGEHSNIQITEYYGEPELRFFCVYEPLFCETFYGYDQNANLIENPIVYALDGTNIKIDFYNTYTTGWVPLRTLKYATEGEILLEGFQLYDYPIEKIDDGTPYFVTLKAMARNSSWYPEMHIQTVAICEAYYVDVVDAYYPNAIIAADTIISCVQVDTASVAKIDDIVAEYTSDGNNTMMAADGSPYFEQFEITKDEIILNGKVLAQTDLEELYGTMMLGGYMILYDGDTPTHTLQLYAHDNFLDITMQEYGTVFVSDIVYNPPNNQTPTLKITASK